MLISSAVFLARSLGDTWASVLGMWETETRVNMANFERNIGGTFLHDNTMACRTFDLNLIHVTFSRMTRKFSEKGWNSMDRHSIGLSVLHHGNGRSVIDRRFVILTCKVILCMISIKCNKIKHKRYAQRHTVVVYLIHPYV